jgi:hypothetical protein
MIIIIGAINAKNGNLKINSILEKMANLEIVKNVRMRIVNLI